jgi:hypothetical protein
MDFKRRLERLENRIGGESVVLKMPDGETVEFSAGPNLAAKLTRALTSGAATQAEGHLLHQLAECASVEESDGHLFELVRCLALTPRLEEISKWASSK